MQFKWPFHSRHQNIVSAPFPSEWLDILNKNVSHFALLNDEERVRLCGDLRIFLSEKNWEGALGFTFTDEVKVTISAFACLLTLGFPKHEYFPNVDTIIVYPSAYRAPKQDPYGHVVEMDKDARLGEAHGNGPVILSWLDIVTDCENFGHGHNLVLHEFSHKLDFRDGDANGVPYLRDSKEVDEWSTIMTREFDQLVDDAKHRRHSVLSPYGATNAAEFFAVCTEAYFEHSSVLAKQKPGLYQVLADYYGIDWADRQSGTE